MNASIVPFIGIGIAVMGGIGGLWRWQGERLRVQDILLKKQNERSHAILLGIQWLLNKAADKPDTYLQDLIREALK